MAKVSVEPTEFHYVNFDAAEITRLVGEVADLVGLADATIEIKIDESTPLGRAVVTSLDPIVIEVEGGAFENAKAPRQLSDRSVRDVLSRLLFKVSDRRSGRFANAPAEGEVPLPHAVAWDVYAVGRASRAGIDVSKARRLYHFRNRHGFNDVADAAFETLWNADDLTWDELSALVDDVAAAKTPA
ncbi:MAG TPA: hypothetical protein VHC63_02760 [Acidimicrobiales bacterium]|nr:hypothetical protein [Acidimicrobiales bacterium]